jgi:gag-polyprotein putative aspartyl protease
VPCISGSFNPNDGIYHPVVILPVGTPGLNTGRLVNLQLHNFKALFDTGAQVTCISQRVADKLQLIPRGRGRIVSASETKETNTYVFYVGFVMTAAPAAAAGGYSGQMNVFGLFEGLEIHAEDDDDVDVLIGMDVLARGNFTVGFDGRYLLCW